MYSEDGYFDGFHSPFCSPNFWHGNWDTSSFLGARSRSSRLICRSTAPTVSPPERSGCTCRRFCRYRLAAYCDSALLKQKFKEMLCKCDNFDAKHSGREGPSGIVFLYSRPSRCKKRKRIHGIRDTISGFFDERSEREFESFQTIISFHRATTNGDSKKWCETMFRRQLSRFACRIYILLSKMKHLFPGERDQRADIL